MRLKKQTGLFYGQITAMLLIDHTVCLTQEGRGQVAW